MRNTLLLLTVCFSFLMGWAQEYSITSGGQGQSGGYVVNVQVLTKKNPKQAATDLVLECAVKGVMFRGVQSADGYGNQKPLISDPNVEQTKATWFEAFFRDGTYKRFVTMVPTSISVMQNKQIKKWETTATALVDKEALLHYLEESNIIAGMSDLW